MSEPKDHAEPTVPRIVERLLEHGGIHTVHVVPFVGRKRRHLGWQNVVVCCDGTRIGLSPGDEDTICDYGDALRRARARSLGIDCDNEGAC